MISGTKTVKLSCRGTPRRFGRYEFDRARIDIVYQRETGPSLMVIRAVLVQVCREGQPTGRFALTSERDIVDFGQIYRDWSGKDLWGPGTQVTIRAKETPEIMR